VVLGGTSLSGGVAASRHGGGHAGITVLNDGMTMMGYPTSADGHLGVVIVVAVVIDLMQRKCKKRIALK
jgi:ribose/xylose/arabinose/galactoside ABC-type transport system permease subunit